MQINILIIIYITFLMVLIILGIIESGWGGL